MRKVIVRAPTRADLAGGTLDLWPLYLFFPESCTVNVAISLYASCEISKLDDSSIEVSLPDEDYEQRFETFTDLAGDPRVRIVAGAVEHFRINGIRIVMRSDAPKGSGLGGSSALAVALVRGLSEIAEHPLEGDRLIELVRDLETRLIGVPAGVQDYYPAVYGGLGSIRLDPGRIHRQPVKVPLHELAACMVLHDSGIEHFSGSNNWEIYKKTIDGDSQTRRSLAGIAAAAIAMESALNSFDLVAAGAALAEEWKYRKSLGDGVSTPEIDQLIRVASRAGAWGGKVCGAGGGGVIVYLVDPVRRNELIAALSEMPGRTLEASPVAPGLVVESSPETAGTSAPARRALGSDDEELRQYFLLPGREPVEPFAMIELSITWDDTRTGFRHTEQRSWVAPVNVESGRVGWQDRLRVEPSAIDLTSNPPRETIPDSRHVDTVVATVRDSIDALIDIVSEGEKLPRWSNPPLDVHSKPGESRDEFRKRCEEAARKSRELAIERLESTFRRRVDQVRERFEKDARQLAEEAEGDSDLPEVTESGIPWGQILHDITTGKPAKEWGEPTTGVEADYLNKLDELRRVWEREQSVLDEEMARSLETVEETILAPGRNHIQIQRTWIVWAPALDAFGRARVS